MISKDLIDNFIIDHEICFFFFVLILIVNIFDISFNLKIDSLVMVLGNFTIAYYIAKKITKSQKTEELKINNCFKELDYLQQLITELKNGIKTKCEHDITRGISLIMLQIELIKNYSFVPYEIQEKIFNQFKLLEKQLTGEDTIDEGYMFSILQIERTILNIKSKILQ